MGIRPRKGLGQNFLVDPAHRARIVAAAELSRADTVLEIGPGPGVLTELLAEQAGRVVAVELDDRLIPFLRQHFAAQPHVSIVHGDILKLDIPALLAASGSGEADAGSSGLPPNEAAQAPTALAAYKVVANLPYYITGAVIPHVLESAPPPILTVFTVQREVAERMTAQPPDMSLLALGVQFYSLPEIVDRIPAGAFHPVPKVDSAVVRMRQRSEPAVVGVAAQDFFRVARAGFGQRRKQLRNSLGAGLSVSPAQAEAWLSAAGVLPSRRAETLTLAEWGAVAQVVVAARASTGRKGQQT